MKKILFILFHLVFYASTVDAQWLYFKHLGIADGLSQVCIRSIYQDELGAIWLGTTEGLNRYNGKTIKSFHPSLNDEGLTNNDINKLCGDKQGRMYIRSGNDLVRYDVYKERFTCIKNDVGGFFCKGDTLWMATGSDIYYSVGGSSDFTLVTSLPQGMTRVEDLYVDEETIWGMTHTNLIAISRKNPAQPNVLLTFGRGECVSGDSAGNIWIGTWNGLYRIDRNKTITHYVSSPGNAGLSDNQVRCVQEDNFKRIWIGTFHGLDCYDPATERWTHYTRYGNLSNTLSHHSVLSLHKDMQGNIWTGTYYGGVSVFNPDEESSRFYCAEPFYENFLSFPVVGKMTEDKRGDIWICTEGGGLNRYNKDTGIFTRYQHKKGDKRTVGSDNLKSIYYCEENDKLYAGTHLGGLFVLDLKSNNGHVLHHTEGDSGSLPHEIVNDIQKYKNGVAVLTQRGPVYMDLQTERFSSLIDNDSLCKQLSREYMFETFLIDSRQRMWLSMTQGGLLCVDLLTSKATRYESDVNDITSIGKFKVVHIFEDSEGDIYFCTIGSGLLRYQEKEDSFKSYGLFNQNFPSNYCYYIEESQGDHRLYVLHSKGLSIIDKRKKQIESTNHQFSQTYSQGSALYLDKNGDLFISGTNGLALFTKQAMSRPSTPNLLCFDRLFVSNKEIVPNDETGILTDVLAKTSEVYLNSRQNSLMIEFANFNYDNNYDRLFEYHLDGFDKGWSPSAGTIIAYTNLPSGNYILKVRPLGGRDEEVQLKIHIATPFYITIWAYLFYFLLVLFLIAFFTRSRIKRAALQSSLEAERREKKSIEELNQAKFRFFTNISHEFRTPLTLIVGQIEVILQMGLPVAIHNRILRVHKNALHLRNLISELLDFRKQEQGYLKLKVEEQDLVVFVHQIYMNFYEYAQSKGIIYRFDSAESALSVWLDVKQFQKVIFNLLSNAFKYTPEKGTITVEVKKVASQAVISVSDTGCGIPAEALSNIFDRFYQANFSSSSFTPGTGIGLALAKGIMELHHGKIEVESAVGKGTKFSMLLPLGYRHFNEEEIVTAEETKPANIAKGTFPFGELMEGGKQNTEDEHEAEYIETETKPAVLLIDDNDELLSMLKDMFSPLYTVYAAHNGNEGWEMVQEKHPDLVVSDVMMLGMTGTELCYKIKSNIATSHIPVVLLTAQTSEEGLMEGLKLGADDYVTKPFDIKFLLVRCGNLIKNKQRLTAHYTNRPMPDAQTAETTNEKDRKFVEECVNIIKENFENPHFDVNMLASELHMGRSKLYAHFKSVVGLTPSGFILKIKLDEAMLLLKDHSELNISEISYHLGFSSPRYFSKSFKAYFGVTPQAIRSGKSS